MSDPRNVAHEKKVKHAKGKEHGADAPHERKVDAAVPTEVGKEAHEPGELEKSLAVLSKLREMEFHSRANIETLAGLSLTIEDELKQKDFAGPIGELYGAQDGFQTRITALIESYGTKCESLKPTE